MKLSPEGYLLGPGSRSDFVWHREWSQTPALLPGDWSVLFYKGRLSKLPMAKYQGQAVSLIKPSNTRESWPFARHDPRRAPPQACDWSALTPVNDD